jgi:ABC-type multidrug transport system ATPase subunit
MSKTIEANDLRKVFRSRVILDGLSFSWNPGTYCLYGMNGRGKSTLLRILAGADRKFEGSLRVLGRDAVRAPEYTNQLRSFLCDDPVFYPKTTTLDLLSFVASVRKLDIRKVLAEGCEKFGLNELLSKPLEQQSLGQRKRSFFGAALLNQVPVWILDEPTNGLDTQYQSAFLEHVKSHVAAGGTAIIASHDRNLSISLNARSLYLYPESPDQPVNRLQ